MTLIDISVPLRPGMPLFPDDPPLSLERVSTMTEGGVCNLSRLDMGVHSGTHIDAPMHFIDGAGGIGAFPIEAFCGPAIVLDATGRTGHIDAAAIEGMTIPPGCHRLLFKTANSALWDQPSFSPDFLALLPDAARALVEMGIRLVGIDYLSVAPYADPAPTHIAFLRAGVVILEGLDLRGVEPGAYELLCLPLRLEGIDGVPARAFLREMEGHG